MKLGMGAMCVALIMGCGVTAQAQVFGFGGQAGAADPEAPALYGAHAFSDEGPDPYVIAVRSGGDLAARRSGFPNGCYGVVTSAPTVEVQVAPGQAALTLFTAGRADTTLAVLDPDGQWRCDDDGARRGTNAALSYSNPVPGAWKVWVGDFDDRQSDTLLILSDAAPFSRPFGAPNARALDAPVQTLTLSPGFMPDPVVIDIQTGYGFQLGSMDVYGEDATGRCPGWTGEVPTAEISWTGENGPLVFMAEGEADVVMDVITPSGDAICSDDMGEVDDRAQLVFAPAEPGVYQVFVGTYMRFDRATNAQLSISETPFSVNEDPW
ncbi:hypothetical protein ABWI01_08625 [Oceanicaulis alexandrii]|uniref:hypothetical protein n=1 Tax=Oceanicaulis alexandrii TaxID=153233 RepID=UPI0035D103E8